MKSSDVMEPKLIMNRMTLRLTQALQMPSCNGADQGI